MDFKVGIEGTYGCAGFRGELRIHVIPHVMRVVVTDRTIAKVANIRHGVLVYLQVRDTQDGTHTQARPECVVDVPSN